MANAIYDKAREAFLSGGIDMTTATIKAILVDAADYTVNTASDQYLSAIPGAAIVSTVTLGTKTVTSGVFDAADATFSSVVGDQSEAIVIYKDTGNSATSPLIAYIDNATGLPVTPNGSNITVSWDNGTNKIFKL